MNFGGVMETVVTSKEFSLEKAREVLKNETIAVIGYGIQGPGQACNLRDNGFNVIVGQREGKTYDKAVADGWVPGKTLFSIEAVSYTHLRAHETPEHLVCRLLLEKKKKNGGCITEIITREKKH